MGGRRTLAFAQLAEVDRAEAEAFRATVQLFLATPEPLAPHPLLGSLSAAEWRRFHCIHAAHHLSFLRENISGLPPTLQT